MDRERRAQPQHRILAIDGGGVRGLIALGALERVEAMLRRQTGDPGCTLSHYFDLIAGTSTGAVIAAGLSFGMTVAELRRLYIDGARDIFRKSRASKRIWRWRYDASGLRTRLRQIFGDETLGSPRLRTLLLLTMRNVNTDSPWLISNNALAKYNDPSLPDCNLNLPLWQLVRASAAAPTMFEPEEVTIGGARFAFMDGATTPYNNPSFQAFLLATLDCHRLCWGSGTDRLLLVSIGTGTRVDADARFGSRDATLLYVARHVPLALVAATTVEQDLLCRVFGDCLVGEPIDSELGDLKAAAGPVMPKLFTYLRYDLELSRASFRRHRIADIDPAALRLDAIDRLDDMVRLGALLGQRVDPAHFAAFPAPPAI